MHWVRASLVTALLVVLALPATAQDWKGRGRVQGRVTTESGEPIEGAKIIVYYGDDKEQGPEPTTTNKKGRWSIGGLRNGNWNIVIEKDGFVPAAGSSSVSELTAGAPVNVNLRNLQDTEEAQKGREVRSWIDQANTAFQQGKYDEARGYYEQALPELKEDSHPSVYKAIAQTYLAESKLTDAANALDKALAVTPEDPEALKLFASIKGQQGQTEEALATLKKLIAVNPEDGESIQLIANILVSQGREEEAQSYIDRLPEGTGVDPNAYLNLGIEQYNANSFDEALAYFDKAVAQNANNADAYYYRGLAYLAKGETAPAKADFEKLVELAPDHPRAAEAREFIAAL
jgi:tetratricopeptide (TPR) repeat protein